MYEFKISYLKGLKRSEKKQEQLKNAALWLAKTLAVSIDEGNKRLPEQMRFCGETRVLGRKGSYCIQLIPNDYKQSNGVKGGEITIDDGDWVIMPTDDLLDTLS
jgi:hypothetical protein